MDAKWILAVSVLLQFTAAALALRLVWVTGTGRAWGLGLISAAIFLMGVRRSITLYRLLAGDAPSEPDISAELVALAISVFMVIGIGWISPVFASIARSQTALHKAHEELERSNRDLAQFAYSASHDLLEPLRMMSSYLQALSQRRGDVLDERSGSLIDLSLNAAKRMQQLIDDLLAYSHVGTSGKQFQSVDTGAIVADAIANLQTTIQHERAEVTRDRLPTIVADATLLTQLFQNLIGNAVKFHGQEPPRVHVSCKESGREVIFSVRDNGIGIEPKYTGRIFTVFERLHPQERYSGTGIGLAICKRVVERHGGRIWCESTPGRGSTFHFALPRHVEPEWGDAPREDSTT